jgi:hypothetical protein
MTSYEEQRKERLAESVFEYLGDGITNPRLLLDDLESILNDEVKWSEGELTRRLTALKSFHRSWK